ncbi:hypothetical protein Tco_0196316 [Tanacetum coccineum]
MSTLEKLWTASVSLSDLDENNKYRSGSHYINHMVVVQLQQQQQHYIVFLNPFKIKTMTFKVLLHHYGRFTSPPARKFVGRIVDIVDPVELDSFSTDQMKLILSNCLGYDENSPTFLYMKKPNCSLDSSLIPLTDSIQNNKSLLMYTQTQQNQQHVYISRVELSPLVVADQCKDEGNQKEIQDKPSCSKKVFD